MPRIVPAQMPSRMKPAWLIDEYASMRLTLRCTSASAAPTSVVRTISTQRIGRHVSSCVPSAEMSTRISARERTDLDDRGHEAGDRRRRPLVDVGRPEVERHRRDLEGEADEQQGAAGVEQAGAQQDVPAEEVRDRRQVRRARRAVDQGRAVDEDRRGEPAEQEVLQRGLRGRRAMPVEGDEHVEADREDLEAEEDDDQVVRLGHQHRARRSRRARGCGTRRPTTRSRTAQSWATSAVMMTLRAITPEATTEKPSSTIAWAIVVDAPACGDAAPLEVR